jgi:hypothetical protein
MPAEDDDQPGNQAEHESEKVERASEELERETDKLERESKRLGEDIDQARSDWRAKQQDGGVPGAVEGEDDSVSEGDSAPENAE